MTKSFGSFLAPLYFCTLLGLSAPVVLNAQAEPVAAIMHPMEKIKYKVEFQWGFISPNAGSAQMQMRQVEENGRTLNAYKISLRTSSFFDNIYSLRDEVESFYTSDLVFVRSVKNLVERKKPSTRYMTVNFGANNKATSFRFLQRRKDWIMHDSIVPIRSPYPIVDLFGSVIYLRSLDYSKLQVGARLPITVIDNADIVKAYIIYKGKEVLSIGQKGKYNTLRFVIDIGSDKFSSSNESMEVWISDDSNHIPIQLKSKLKLGAGVAVLQSTSGLKYPLNRAK
ncbi:MAG: DUF3108 domain-containing protein [Porphyromonas sp.]|nr:DUF3108 domain-containing protein [Porphyromonas sp.]